jgi:hypothetical protein
MSNFWRMVHRLGKRPPEGPVSFGKGLYYPYIMLRDVNWLKAALLYWDSLGRIVPPAYPPRDDEEFKPALPLLVPIDPSPYAEGAEMSFRNRVMPLLEPGHEAEATRMLAAVEQFVGKDSVTVHIDKMTWRLRDDLRELGLASDAGQEWLRLEKGLDAVYMICLATEISTALNAPPVTDVAEYAACGEYLQFAVENGHSLGPPEVDGLTPALIQLGVDLPTPDDLEHVSLETVVKYHRDRADERIRYRKAVELILGTASAIEDPLALPDFLSQERRQIVAAIDDYKKTLDEIHVTSIRSALTVTVPTVLAGAVAKLAELNANLASACVGLGFAIGVVAWWADCRRELRKTKSCPWHYLLKTRQKFGEKDEW